MKILKTIALASFALTSYVAQATVIDAGGIQYDPINGTGTGAQGNVKFQQWYSAAAYGTGLDGQTTITSNAATSVGLGFLTGVGAFTDFNVDRTLTNNWLNDFLNASPAKSYCTDATSGCALTFAFGGLALQSIVGNQVTFNTANSFLNIYFQSPMNSALSSNFGNSPLNPNTSFAQYQQGTLWATLKFNSFVLTGDVNGGTVNSTLDLLSGLPSVLDNLDFGNVDFKLTGNAIINSSLYSENGSGAFQSVPAPSSLAVLGLGLLGLAGAARRKQAK